MRDYWEAVKTKISNASSRDFVICKKQNSLLSHSMNAWTETGDCNAVELSVKSSLNLNVIWKKEEEDKVQSVVGCL